MAAAGPCALTRGALTQNAAIAIAKVPRNAAMERTEDIFFISVKVSSRVVVAQPKSRIHSRMTFECGANPKPGTREIAMSVALRCDGASGAEAHAGLSLDAGAEAPAS